MSAVQTGAKIHFSKKIFWGKGNLRLCDCQIKFCSGRLCLLYPGFWSKLNLIFEGYRYYIPIIFQ